MIEEFLYWLWRHVSFAMQPPSGCTKTQSRPCLSTAWWWLH